MIRKISAYIFLLILFFGIILPKAFAEGVLTQYGEIASLYNDEVKIKCKDPLSGDVYYFKFYIGWSTVFDGVSGKAGLRTGDFINVNYGLDISQKPIATKISFPKELSQKQVSPSGTQSYSVDNQEMKDLRDEVKNLKAEISQIKAQQQDKH